MLDTCVELGITDLEFPVGGWSTAPHCDADTLLGDAAKLDDFLNAVTSRGLRICAVNANGNQLHPLQGDRDDRTLRRAVDFAQRVGAPTVVCMSGLPGGGAGDRTPNWVTTAWPPETQDILEYQWNNVALPYWEDLASYGEARGVRFAVEMHGNQLVYNARTLLRLREAVGDRIGANLDTSHPMWQGADPRAVVGELQSAIYHVHAKDLRLNPGIVETHGVLDTTDISLPRDRAWNFVTLGLGQPGGTTFWGQLLSDLRLGGYDGVLAIEHEDLVVDAVEGLRHTVDLLDHVMPRASPSWQPAAI
ncbi:MAG: sugar phosphate isomerase/epimerase family protein [Corynebacterium sp.]|uniref:sugar phosphate isomerase/epimerase family protein n=1 Tax=Corynebacterium sp. TaxID=1720 RepID=UPI003F981C36